MNWLTVKEIEARYKEQQKYAHKCKCGHTVFVVNKTGRAECKHCHNLVFKDDLTKFKYIMNQKLIKERKKKK